MVIHPYFIGIENYLASTEYNQKTLYYKNKFVDVKFGKMVAISNLHELNCTDTNGVMINNEIGIIRLDAGYKNTKTEREYMSLMGAVVDAAMYFLSD